jgi:mevalonate kinase
MDVEKFVINLTNKPHEPAAVSMLSKGTNHAQTTSLQSNLKDIISGVQEAIQHLSTEHTEEIRQEMKIRHTVW